MKGNKNFNNLEVETHDKTHAFVQQPAFIISNIISLYLYMYLKEKTDELLLGHEPMIPQAKVQDLYCYVTTHAF